MKYIVLSLVFLLSKVLLLCFILNLNFYKNRLNIIFIKIWHSKYKNYYIFLISFLNNLFFINLFSGNLFTGNISIIFSAQDVKNIGVAVLQNIDQQNDVINVDGNTGENSGNIEVIDAKEEKISYWDEKVSVLGYETSRKTVAITTGIIVVISIITIGITIWYCKSGGNITIEQKDDEEKVVSVSTNIDLKFYDENGNMEGFFNETTKKIEDGYINDQKFYDLNGNFKGYIDTDDIDSYDENHILVRHYDEEGRVFDKNNLFIGFVGENDTVVSIDDTVYSKDLLMYDKNVNFIGFAGENNTIISPDNIVYNENEVIFDENDVFIEFKKDELQLDINITKEESSSSINDDEYKVDNFEEIKLTNIDNNSFEEILSELSNDEMNFLNNSRRSYSQDQLAERVVEYWNYKSKIDNNITLDEFFVVKSSLQVKYMGTDHIITNSEIKEYNEQRINSKKFFDQ